jgi:hypothetical protein
MPYSYAGPEGSALRESGGRRWREEERKRGGEDERTRDERMRIERMRGPGSDGGAKQGRDTPA